MKRFPAVVFLVGILIVFTWLYVPTDLRKSNGTPLQEYMLMDKENQKLVILESRRVLFHEYLEDREIERASCVAQLFAADTKEGDKQFVEIEAHLENEMNSNDEKMTEMLVNTFIKTNFCSLTDIH